MRKLNLLMYGGSLECSYLDVERKTPGELVAGPATCSNHHTRGSHLSDIIASEKDIRLL